MAIKLIENAEFMQRQYGHLPLAERPTSGAILDITDALATNQNRVKALDLSIRKKRVRTSAWVKEAFPGMEAVQLTRPYIWTDADPDIQEQASKWLMGTIYSVYGEGYPLANKNHGVNMKGFEDKSLLTYYGVIAPEDISNGHINADPRLAMHPDIKAIATSSLVRSPHGVAELGRTARLTEVPQFDGGILPLESGYDLLRNRHRLQEQIHTLIATTRGGAEHKHTPSSGPIQNLLLGQVGMSIVEYAPLYDVNGMEPVLETNLPRTVKERQDANKNLTIFTPAGAHAEYIQTLMQHQMGDITPALEITNGSASYTKAHTEHNGDHIYGAIKVEPDQDGHHQVGFAEATADLEARSPIVRVKIPAHTPEGAAAQRWFIENGYTVTGFHPAENTDYLDMSGSEPIVRRYQSDPIITLAKLGARARTGRVEVVPAYLPTPAESKGLDLHQGYGNDGSKMRELLYQVDHNIRASIGK